MERVVIIGSGPAGLTAAIYAARAGLAPRVLAGALYGGQLMFTTEVENYPGFPEGIMGPELMEHFRAQAERFGARVEFRDGTGVDFARRDDGPLVVHAGDEAIETRSVVIATGASARWLEVPGEAKLRGRGVSTCATCDGAFFREKRICVVGGGDSALEEALFLTRFASEVTVLHRRDVLRASKVMVDRARSHPKIVVKYDRVIEAIHGAEHVEGVTLRDTRGGGTEEFATDAVFVAIGHDPNTGIFRDVIDLDAAGYVRSADGVRTNVPGVFVAGDVFDVRYKQAITAAGSGCRAALEVEKYLEALEAQERLPAPVLA